MLKRSIVNETAQESELLRIFISERDKEGHRPLYEAIVEGPQEWPGRQCSKASRYGAAAGFTTKILHLGDLPLVVEIVDSPEKIESFLPLVGEMFSGNCNCLATREKSGQSISTVFKEGKCLPELERAFRRSDTLSMKSLRTL